MLTLMLDDEQLILDFHWQANSSLLPTGPLPICSGCILVASVVITAHEIQRNDQQKNNK